MAALNTLYYGDNLPRLRHQPDESVDLIYLDPPFNSSRSYNILFKQQKGDASPAQIMAFEDTWKWSNAIYDEFRCDQRNIRLYELMDCLVKMLGKSELMAYLLMMGPRLMEMHRTLKVTGSLYLHCDPTASSYLRIMLDTIFGPRNFCNQVIWKRSDAHNDAKKQFPALSDHILFYRKSDHQIFNRQMAGHAEKTLRDWYQYLEFADGTPTRRMTKEERNNQKIPNGARRFNTDNLRSPNPRPNLTYDYKGYKPHPNGWAVSIEKMTELDHHGLLLYPSSLEGRIMRKKYLDESDGVVVGDVWSDISQLRGTDAERRGYPTQKPLALLERIIAASSNEGDVVLDPFCGCGTAVIQSARMNRRWIGIDITYLAIAEIMYRLDSETEAKLGTDYQIQGIPTDDMSARAFFQATVKQNHKPFEMWAVSLTGAHPIEKKGGDRGIDGRLPIYDPEKNLRWAMVQVKGGALSVSQIRDFAHVVEREKAVFGMFLSLEEPTRQMRKEADELGFLDGYGTRRIPRLQLRTLKELLEDKNEFEIPRGYQPMRDQGVGRAKIVQTEMTL